MECKSLVDRWQSFAENHQAGQSINPWNDWGHRKALDKSDPEYGRPVKGSLTELRGKKAEQHVNNEIRELCHWINVIGKQGHGAGGVNEISKQKVCVWGGVNEISNQKVGEGV